MTLGPLLLLFSALLHASWNAIAKSAPDKESFLFSTIFLSGILTWITVLTFGVFDIPSQNAWAMAVLSGIFEGLYFLTLAKALQESSLGQSYAIMRGGAMVLVWVFSSLFLSERAATVQYVGALFIFGGIVAMNFRELKAGGFSIWRGNLWAFLSAIFIAGYHLCYHRALVQKADPRSLFLVAMVVSLPFLFWDLRRQPWQRLAQTCRTRGVAVVITGCAATASFLIFLYGLRISAPGLAISLRNTSIFFAVVFSYFLKETLSRAQILGACTIGVGAVLLSL